MSDPFPLIEVPEEFYPIVGEPEKGTRLFRKDGPQEEAAPWFEFIAEHFDASLSPGGVGMYCPVSRAAVYKRIKEGRLTMFVFHVTHCKTSFYGKQRLMRDRPYGCIPTSELKAWRAELEERAVRLGTVTREELEGAKPDWDGEFLDWPNRRERRGLLDALGLDLASLPGFLADAVKLEMKARLERRANDRQKDGKLD